MKNKFILFGLTVLLAACASKPTVVSKTEIPAKQDIAAKSDVKDVREVKELKDVVVSMSATEGKNLYENSCARCHKLFEPKEFSKTEWVPILKSMQKKAHLTDAEIAGIAVYINSEL
jgi:cytochrome c5